MEKSETRIPKAERRPQSEIRIQSHAHRKLFAAFGSRISSLSLPSSQIAPHPSLTPYA